MTTSPTIRRLVQGTAGLAVLVVFVTIWLDPPNLSRSWLVPLGVLFTITLVSQLLAVRITEAGSTTTMDFVPHLGAMILVGPSGAALLTILSDILFEFGLVKNPKNKAVFNVSQLTISVIAASWVYILLGGNPSISLPPTQEGGLFLPYVVPFIGGVLTYFTINTCSVSYIIALAQDARFLDVWNRLSGRLILFDIAISPLAYIVAYMYWTLDWFALLLAIIPIIGLRYSYGVNLELQQLNTDLARVLVKTIESQDPYTGGHSLRVSRWATELADSAGLNYKVRRNIETAALLHDIGKVDRIYTEILQHDGDLTPDQRRAIREHPQRGVEMLSAVRSLDDDVLNFIRHHHEHYNGDGYPDGIEGEDIPIGARVIMIADTIDAMMTRRPYRDPLPPEIVKEELINCKGDQFDPELVDTLIEEGLFKEISKSYTNNSQSNQAPIGRNINPLSQ
jgi:putative nucleotidyltransferase with HDIG domain